MPASRGFVALSKWRKMKENSFAEDIGLITEPVIRASREMNIDVLHIGEGGGYMNEYRGPCVTSE